MSRYAIGLDIGGTNLKALVVSEEGESLSQIMHPTSEFAYDQGEWIWSVKSLLLALEQVQGKPPECVGIATPGLVASDGRSIAWMQGRMEFVQGLDWTDALHDYGRVPVLNDAHAALLGEVWRGAARGYRNVLLLTLGTGVGGAAMVDGNLLRGHLGRAGHLGHISLNAHGDLDIVKTPGSLEDAIGECTLSKRGKKRYDSTAELVKAHLEGDAEATSIWLLSVKELAAGIASLINAFDPEAVLLGGGIARAGEPLFTPLAAYLDEFEWRPTGSNVRILPAQLGQWAGAYGAAHHALRSLSVQI